MGVDAAVVGVVVVVVVAAVVDVKDEGVYVS